MKAKVLKKYRDKETKEIRHAGEVIEVSEKRFEEIEETGHYLEVVDEAVDKNTAPEEEAVKPAGEKKAATSRKKSSTGNKK